MADTGWSVLYTRMRTPMYERIAAAAAKDDRTITKWIELHFRDYFEEQDRTCEPHSSEPASCSSVLRSASPPP